MTYVAEGEFDARHRLHHHPDHRRRAGRLPGRGRALPADRGPGLPVGEPGDHRAPPARAGGRALDGRRRPDPRRAQLDLRPRPGRRDPVLGIERLQEAYLARFPDYDKGITVPAIVDVADRPGGHQRLRPDHPRPVDRVARRTTATGAPDLYPEELRDEIDEVTEVVFRDVNNGVYRAGSPAARRPTSRRTGALFDRLDWLSRAARRQRYLVGRHDHRGRRAAVHHAGPLRRRLPRPLQVQPAQAHRDAGAVGLRPRPVPDARASATPSTSPTSSGTTTACTATSTRPGSCRPGPTWPGLVTPHGREELGGRPFGDGTPPAPPPTTSWSRRPQPPRSSPPDRVRAPERDPGSAVSRWRR